MQLCTLFILMMLSTTQSRAADNEPVLELEFGDRSLQLTRTELLSHSDISVLKVARDPAYARAMTYKAVPLLALIGAQATEQFDTLEAAATDGYVSQLPMSLIARGAKNGAVAWIAIEESTRPWPKVPKKDISAGPFYLVWQHPSKSGIRSAQWPYALDSLKGVRSPAMRWPQMAIADPAKHATAHRGMKVFVAHCFVCHQMKGAGIATIGPDLGQPMDVFDYFTEKGLRALIRDPASVRTWPKQEMAGLDKGTLPDNQLDDLISYFQYMARQ